MASRRPDLAAAMAAFVAGSDEAGAIHEQILAHPEKTDDGGWTMVRYWYEGGGEFAVSYGLDMADPLDKDDIPSQDEQDAQWRAYAEYVAETGDDSLSEYMAGEPKRVTDYVVADVFPASPTDQPWLARWMVLGSHNEWQFGPAVAWLSEYLGLRVEGDRMLVLDDFSSLDGLMESGYAEAKWRLSPRHVRLLVKIEHWNEVDPQDKVWAKQAAAREHLAGMGPPPA